MGKKKRSWGKRAFSGYVDYRYGGARSVTLPPILKGKRREHVVNRVIDTLKDWRLSPFENEAATYHGARQAFCIEGFPFAQSEQEAAAIVAEGLKAVGAQRPSWAEGQPSYSDGVDHCLWCSQPLPDDAFIGNRKFRYCSDICAKAAFERRAFSDTRSDNKVYAATYRAVRRQKMLPRTCAHCAAAFRPLSEDDPQRFCSQACAGASARLPEILCLTCGKPTRADVSYRERKYCSTKCYGARKLEATFARTCLLCGSQFRAVSEKANYCCEAHAATARKTRAAVKAAAKTGRVIRMTAPVFDYVFSIAA
ncbi:MAG: hypothetical protein J0H11_13640 [Rhizobiales bacterium]|nr:hypothetical protein [Hyphomicrobiales bacterium]